MTEQEVNEFRQLIFVFERMRKAVYRASRPGTQSIPISENIVQCRAILAKYEAENANDGRRNPGD